MPKLNRETIAQYSGWSDVLADLDPVDRAGLLEEMADKGLYDLHFFCVVALGIDCMTPTDGLHGRVCRFLDDESKTNKWLEVHRGGMKSTIGTVAKSLQTVCREPERQRHMIMSADEGLSESFLLDIRQKVEDPAFQLLYPRMAPDRRMWKGEKARIAASKSREATWVAAGILSKVTGGHYTQLHWDDLVVPENVETRDGARKVIKKFYQLTPIKDQWDTPQFMCSTPYETYDLYAYIKRTKSPDFHRLAIPVMDGAGVPAWPEEFPKTYIEELRRADSKVFWSQYMLRPRDIDSARFHRDRFQWFRWGGERVRSDWEDRSAEPVAITRESLTYYMAVDLAMGVPGGDETVLTVVGIDAFSNVYVVETVHGLFDYTATIPLIWELAERWDVQQTWVEMQGPHKSFSSFLEVAMRERKSLYIDSAPTGNRNKEGRCEAVLAHLYNNRKIWHHQALWGGELEQQLEEFPGGALDDVRDATAYAVELATKQGFWGAKTEEQKEQQVRSSFGRHERIGYTREQMQGLVPQGLVDLALGKAVRRGL